MFERCLYFNINALTRAINLHWEQAYQTAGLSPAHAYLLRAVLANPGMTQKQLAAELQLAPSTITRFVDVLSARGLLQRRTAAGDGREWIIVPGDAARELHEELERIGEQLFQKLRGTLGETRFTELVAELRSVNDALQGAARSKESLP